MKHHLIKIKLILICMSLMIVSKLSSQNLNINLLLHYAFDNNFQDDSPNDFDANSINTSFTSDRFNSQNNAVMLTGNSCIILPDSPELKPQFPFSVSTWFNASEILDSKNAHYSLFGTDQTQDNYLGAFITILNTGELLIGYGDGSGCTSTQCRAGVISEEKIKIETWYHLVVNFENPSNISVYLNGCLLETLDSGTGSKQLIYGSIPGAIGKNDHSSIFGNPISYFNGSIDDFYFWNRIITEEEVYELNDNFHSIPTRLIEYSGCINDNFEISVNGTKYNSQNPKGIENITYENGCDSIIDINLTYSELETEPIVYEGCAGDMYELIINDQLYNEQNPQGEEIVARDETVENNIGCDTLFDIKLIFNTHTDTTIKYEGLSGDNYNIEIEGQSFSEENSTGIIYTKNKAGCDSTITVELNFINTKQCSYYIPNTLSNKNSRLIQSFYVYTDKECQLEVMSNLIFDRWGNLIHSSSGSWNGTINGEKVAAGSYAFQISFKLQNKNFIERGSVLVLD